MKEAWNPTSLRDAGVTLIDCDHRTPPASNNGYPYVAIPQLKEGRIELKDVRRISPENYLEWTRKAKPQEHDVILSRRCNPGETAHVPAGLECALGQNLVLLRADGSKLYPPFLRWLVRGPHWWEQVGKFINVGAVFESLKCAEIPNFKMPLPGGATPSTSEAKYWEGGTHHWTTPKDFSSLQAPILTDTERRLTDDQSGLHCHEVQRSRLKLLHAELVPAKHG
jgi:hypothetical protein